MAKPWVFCDCCSCSPNLTLGGPGGGGLGGGSWDMLLGRFAVNTIEVDTKACTVIRARLGFATEALARHYVGEGNYSDLTWMTEEWVLFNDGLAFARDDSRPIPFVITYEEHPAGFLTPTSIDLNNGAFIWTRASDDPTSADFVKFNQTTGAEIESGEGQQWCVGINANASRQAWLWEGDPFDIEIGFTTGDEDPPCPQLNETICVTWQPSDPIDGWYFGGAWTVDEVPYSIDCGGGPFDGHRQGWFVAFGGPYMHAGVYLTNGLCTALARFGSTICRDPRTEPTVDDFDLEGSTCDDVTFTTLNLNASCEGSGETNCPPEDCPIQFCKWQWNVDTQEWDLIESNCIEPAECPDPPDAPTITDVTWVECNCCITVSPMCDPSHEECLGDECVWVWSTLANDWNASACLGFDCLCQGKPERPGDFNGETVLGICCREIV